jgi:hypothetical protein
VLRQDEVAEFVRSSKGEKYSALLPLFGLHDLEVAAENLRKLARSAESQAMLRHKQGALEQIMVRRKEIFRDESDTEIEAKIEALYKKYCPTGQVAAPLDRCNDLDGALASHIGALTAENQQYFGLRRLAELDFAATIKTVRDCNAQLAGSVEPLINEKLAVLQSADTLVYRL